MCKFLLSAMVAVAASVSTSYAGVVIIDFNDLGRGDTIADQYAEHVRFSSAPGRNGFGNAMIFDTNNYSGGDRDLAGPLKNSKTGALVNFRKVAIISEDNDASDPDDNRTGGSLIMNFTRGVTFLGFDALDINAKEGVTLDLFGVDGTLLGSFDSGSRRSSDNEFFSILTGGVSDVFKAVIGMSGSGAVDNIRFSTDALPTPIPAALPFMLTGLGGIAWARRRKGNAYSIRRLS